MRWVAALLLLSLSLPNQDGRQERKEVLDEDYRFRLVAPSSAWLVLDEREAQKVVPDAVAMLHGPGGLCAAVIVEHAPGVEVASMARLILDSMPVEDRVEESYFETRFQEREAVRFQLSGTIDDQHFRYLNTVFLHGEFLCQVLCFGNVANADRDGRAFEPALAAFTLLEGEPTGRGAARADVDARGVGWSFESGVFRSAPYALRVEARAPWRVVVGDELDEMNPDAEVGLVCALPDVYLVLVSERVVGFSAGEVAAQKTRAAVESMEEVGDPMLLRVADIEVRLHAFRAPEQPLFTFLQGAFARGEFYYHVVAWFMGPRTEAVSALITSAGASIGFLTGAEQAELSRASATLPDPESQVGADFSLRAGTYRDYGAALTWIKPPGWRASAGQAARDQWGETARLAFEEPALGVYGFLRVYEAVGDLADEHDEIVWELAEEGSAESHPVALGGAEALESTFSSGTGIERTTRRVVTALAGERVHELVFFGFEGNMGAAKAAIERACAGFRLGVELEPPGVRDGVYRDEKLGFTFASPGPGWSANTRLTPGEAGQLAGSCGWSDGGNEAFAIAIGVLRSGMDESGLEQLVLKEILRQVPGPSETVADTLDGLPARRLTFVAERVQIEVLITRHENTLFFVGVSGPGAPTLVEAQELFAFLP